MTLSLSEALKRSQRPLVTAISVTVVTNVYECYRHVCSLLLLYFLSLNSILLVAHAVLIIIVIIILLVCVLASWDRTTDSLLC